ncbi:transposase, MuDR, MULE transposase domain protein [Tanacetum coccineum]
METYNVYSFVWSLKIYILELYRNSKFWWKKDPLVIPRGLSWSKIGKFKKGDYGALFAKWSNPILCMAPTSTELLQPWLIRSMDYFRTLLVDRVLPNDRITASPHGNQPIICDASVHDPQFVQQSKQVVESVPVYTSEELVAEYHSITTSVKLIENVGDGDPSIVLKAPATVKQRINAIERFIKSRNDNMSEDSVAKQSVEKEIESSGGMPDSAISNVFIGEISCENLVQEQLQVQLQSCDMCIQSIGNQYVQHPLESPNGKRPESSISDVLNGELSFDKKTRNIYHGESSKNVALSEEIDPKEYDKNIHESGDGKVSESEIINVFTGDVSCDKYVGGFYDESQVNEYAGFDFDNTENDSLSDIVKTGEEEIHLDGLEKVDDPFEMSMYVNEVNVVNENEPPSSVKVVGQLLRKRFVGKALVEPYTVQPRTTAPSVFVRVDRKRRKRKGRMLQIKNTHISFDDYHVDAVDDVGDDEPDFCVISLEEWESTQFKRARKKKEPIRQSQIVMKDIPLVEFHENLSRAPYSRRTKVKLPECIDTVYALGDETSHRFPWGNNDIDVYRSFWLNLLGFNDGGWLSQSTPKDADWAIASSYFCSFVMRGDIPGWVYNGVRYPVNWANVKQVFFSINESNEHYCLGILHIRTGVITLYDSLFSKAIETRKWWIKMRIAFKTYIPTYLQEWGILDAKGIPIES